MTWFIPVWGILDNTKGEKTGGYQGVLDKMTGIYGWQTLALALDGYGMYSIDQPIQLFRPTMQY
jgi:hypothetical protein